MAKPFFPFILPFCFSSFLGLKLIMFLTYKCENSLKQNEISVVLYKRFFIFPTKILLQYAYQLMDSQLISSLYNFAVIGRMILLLL